MPQLDARRTYADGSILFAADLDAVIDDIETLVNTTKLNDDNIQDAGITGSTKLVDASVTAGKLASNSVTTAKITDSNVTTAKIADSNVTTAKIADLNVTTGKLAASAVTTAKIADAAVTVDKIADNSVQTAKILNSHVTTAKIADGAVTNAKLAALNYAASASTGVSNNSSGTLTSLTSVAHTSSGRPVLVKVVPDGSGVAAQYSKLSTNSTGGARWRLQSDLDGILAEITLPNGGTSHGFEAFVASPTASSATYTLYSATLLNNDAQTHYMRIVVIEQ